MSESSVEYEYTISIPSLSRSPYTTVAHSEKQAILRIVYRVFSKRYSKAKLNSVVTDIIQNDKYKVLGRNPINVFDYEKLKDFEDTLKRIDDTVKTDEDEEYTVFYDNDYDNDDLKD